jgi:hypothetical protein
LQQILKGVKDLQYFTSWQCKDHDNAFLAPYLHVLPIVSCAEGDEHDRLGCFGDLLLPVTPTMLPRGSPEAVDLQACTSWRSDVQKEVYSMVLELKPETENHMWNFERS